MGYLPDVSRPHLENHLELLGRFSTPFDLQAPDFRLSLITRRFLVVMRTRWCLCQNGVFDTPDSSPLAATAQGDPVLEWDISLDGDNLPLGRRNYKLERSSGPLLLTAE